MDRPRVNPARAVSRRVPRGAPCAGESPLEGRYNADMAIVLFTDFGSGDIYVGQVKAVLQRLAPATAVIDLLHDAPAFNVRASGHLLWQPEQLSASFHGRDLFAPVAATLAVQGGLPKTWFEHSSGLDVEFGSDDLPEIIYVDHYGNAHSGIRASGIPRDVRLALR